MIMDWVGLCSEVIACLRSSRSFSPASLLQLQKEEEIEAEDERQTKRDKLLLIIIIMMLS